MKFSIVMFLLLQQWSAVVGFTDAPSMVPKSDAPESLSPTTSSPTDSSAPSLVSAPGKTTAPTDSSAPSKPPVTESPTDTSAPSSKRGTSVGKERHQNQASTSTPTDSPAPSKFPSTFKAPTTAAPTETVAPTTEAPTDASSSASTTTYPTDDPKKVSGDSTDSADGAGDMSWSYKRQAVKLGQEMELGAYAAAHGIQVSHSRELSAAPIPTSPPSSVHSVQIQVKYDSNPEETMWALFDHPVTPVVEVQFNNTAWKAANRVATIVFDNLASGKYYFKIIDSALNGLNGGWYRIIDVTDGRYRLIHNGSGNFTWYDYVEFTLRNKST